MITAREALQLPSARLSDDDAALVANAMANIESMIRHEFRRGPLRIPIPREYQSPVVTAEIKLQCRRALWRVGWEQQVGRHPITGEQAVLGQYLTLEPMPEAYEEAQISAMDMDIK